MDERDYAQKFPLTIITVVRGGENLPAGKDRLLGRGVQFDTGTVVLEWYLDAYPPSQRLDNPHQSIYGSLDDLQQATKGEIIVEGEVF